MAPLPAHPTHPSPDPAARPLGSGRVALFLTLLAAFGCGVVLLFQHSAERGSLYPPYSSSRADPLGTRALREGLAALPGNSVTQHYGPLSTILPSPQTALIIAGAGPEQMLWETGSRPFEEPLLTEGGRLIVAFAPVMLDREAETTPSQATLKRFGPLPADVPTSAALRIERSMQREWVDFVSDHRATLRHEPIHHTERGLLDYTFNPAEHAALTPEEREQLLNEHREQLQRDVWTEDFSFQPIEARRGPGAPDSLPETIPLRSARVFTDLAPEWRVIYQRGEWPVLIERNVGPGTLVLAADAFFLSNESLRQERQTALLAWALGRQSTIVFDEAHLGVSENPGMVQIARRMGLGGTLLGLVLLGALFVWRASSSLVPPRDERDAPELAHGMAAGRDAAAGFLNMLRAHIPVANLLEICLAQWRASYLADHRELAARAAQADAVAQQELQRPPRQRNTPAAYRQIRRILNPRSPRP